MIDIPDEKLPKGLRKRELVVFIDGNHLFHRLKYWYGTYDIDILKLSKSLCTESRNLIQIRYYYSPFIEQVNKDNYSKQDSYVKRLSDHKPLVEFIPGHYIKKPIVQSEDIMRKIESILTPDELYTYIEKETDVHIATDMVSFACDNKFQEMILISGDSDFTPAITEVRNLNKIVQVAAFSDEENSCHDLTNCATSFINLHPVISNILHKKRRKPQPIKATTSFRPTTTT